MNRDQMAGRALRLSCVQEKEAKQALQGGAFWNWHTQGLIRASSHKRGFGDDIGFRIAKRKRDWKPVVRAGAFTSSTEHSTSSARLGVLLPRQLFDNLGFRVAKRKR